MPNLRQRFPRYSRLLGLYPAPFRDRYAEPALQTLADMLDDPGADRTSIWLHVAADLPISLLRQQAINLGDIMTHDTKTYIKTNAVLSGLMLVPFTAALIANAFIPGHLYNSWPWKYHVLLVWVLILPAAAAALSLATFAFWAGQRRRAGVSIRNSLLDLPHNWPMLIFAAAGLGILGIVFFHDSVRCVTGNPFSELHHWHQTWRCIQQR